MAKRRMYQHLDAAGLVRFVAKATELYQAGQSLREVADALNCPYTTLYGRLRKAGITLRTRRGTR